LYFVCTCLYLFVINPFVFRLYLKQLNKKWKIKNGQRATLRFFNFICHSKENRLYPFILLLWFVSQKVRRYSAFQFLRDPYIANLANFQDIEMRPTAFERESFVPVCNSLTFVCTSKDLEIQHVSVFVQSLYSELSQFSRYRNETNGIWKRIICTRLYLPYFRLHLKGFGDKYKQVQTILFPPVPFRYLEN